MEDLFISGVFNFFLKSFFLRQGFFIALESVLELALVDHAGLELTKISLALPPDCTTTQLFF